MAINNLEIGCSTNKQNTGRPDCIENFGGIKKFILSHVGDSISTLDSAMLEATWQAKLNSAEATRIYPFPEHFILEPKQEDLVQESGTFGEDEVVREGKEKMTIQLEKISIGLHKALRTHNGGKNLAFHPITEQGYIEGYTDDGIVFKPIPLSKFFVLSQTLTDGSKSTRTRIELEWKPGYWNDKPAYIKPTAFDPLLLDGILDVRLSIVAAIGATSAKVLVAGSIGANGIVGLVSANFRLYADSAPSTPKAVTATDNLDGTYSLTWSSISGAHSLTLFSQPIGTAGYEAINTLTQTVA